MTRYNLLKYYVTFDSVTRCHLSYSPWHWRSVQWENLIISKKLNHLRYSDDIVIIAESPEDIQRMLNDLDREATTIDLDMKLQKTKVMCKENPHTVIRRGDHVSS